MSGSRSLISTVGASIGVVVVCPRRRALGGRRDDAGFTLVETVVAVALLGLAVTAILGGWSLVTELSTRHRQISVTQAVLANAARVVASDDLNFVDCVAEDGSARTAEEVRVIYDLALRLELTQKDALPEGWSADQVAIIGLEWGTGSPTGTVFTTQSCQEGNGVRLQRLVVRVTEPAGGVVRTTSVVKGDALERWAPPSTTAGSSTTTSTIPSTTSTSTTSTTAPPTGITRVGNATAVNHESGSTSLTVPVPAGAQVGDLLLAQVTHEKGNQLTVVSTQGWTVVRRTDRGSDIGQTLLYRIVVGGEPASYTWQFKKGSSSEAVRAAGAITVYRNVDTDHPAGPVVASNGASGDSTTLTVSGVTAPGGSRLVAAFGFKKQSTLTDPTGMGNVYQRQHENQSGPTIRASDAEHTVGGTTGSRSSTASGGAEKWVAQLVALRSRP